MKKLKRLTPEDVCKHIESADIEPIYDLWGTITGFLYGINHGGEQYTTDIDAETVLGEKDDDVDDVDDEDVDASEDEEEDEEDDDEEEEDIHDAVYDFENLENPAFYNICLELATMANIGEADYIHGTPAAISIDNGTTHCTVEEALAAHTIDEWTILMIDDIREYVQEELPDDCTDAQFLMRYLELAPVDLIIG